MAKKRDISGFEINESSAPIKRGKDYFLGIGINEYTDFDSLNNAVKDIQDFSQLLETQFGFEKKYIRLVLEKEATRRNIIRQLNTLSDEVKEEDRVLIYYSGHGYLNKRKNLGYWIPIDAEQGYKGDYIANSEVQDLIKVMDCRHLLLISDSCFSGSLLVRDAGEEEDNAFDYWEENPSRWIFCSGKGVVSDGEKEENSPFAHQLIKHLSQAKVDKININALADKVIRSVRFGHEQQAEACPLYGSGHDGGQFIFYKKNKEEDTERAAFETAKESKDINVLIRFLENSNNKIYKREIRKILRPLEQDKAWERVDKRSFASVDEFIDEYPKSPHLKAAMELKERLKNQTGKSKPKEEIKKPSVTIPRKKYLYQASDGTVGKKYRMQLSDLMTSQGIIINEILGLEAYGLNYSSSKFILSGTPLKHGKALFKIQFYFKNTPREVEEGKLELVIKPALPKKQKVPKDFDKDKQKALIKANKLDQVFLNIREWLDTKKDTEALHKKLTLLENKYKTLLTSSRLGGSSITQQSKQKQSIIKSLVNLIEEVEHSTSPFFIRERLLFNGFFTDPRDGQSYKVVPLKDGNIWMAQNLNFDIGAGSWTYQDKERYGAIYGRLYNWEAAMKACPEGWHIPSKEEWWSLRKAYGGSANAYEPLIDGGETEFNALLGGYRGSNKTFYRLKEYGCFWSSTMIKNSKRVLGFNFQKNYKSVKQIERYQSFARSVRCILNR